MMMIQHVMIRFFCSRNNTNILVWLHTLITPNPPNHLHLPTCLLQVKLKHIQFSDQIARLMVQHGVHLGPVGPRWAPCWTHEPSVMDGDCCLQSYPCSSLIGWHVGRYVPSRILLPVRQQSISYYILDWNFKLVQLEKVGPECKYLPMSTQSKLALHAWLWPPQIHLMLHAWQSSLQNNWVLQTWLYSLSLGLPSEKNVFVDVS